MNLGGLTTLQSQLSIKDLLSNNYKAIVMFLLQEVFVTAHKRLTTTKE